MIHLHHHFPPHHILLPLLLVLLLHFSPIESSPIQFLAAQRLDRFWPSFEELGVVHVEDFLLVTQEDLIDFDFKPIHVRKFNVAIEQLKANQGTTLGAAFNLPSHTQRGGTGGTSGTASSSSLSHAKLLMNTKLRKMKISTLQKHLNMDDPTMADSNYQTEMLELKAAIEQLHRIALEYGMAHVMKDATLDDLEHANGQQQLVAYFKELSELQLLKLSLEGVLDNVELLTVDALRNPLILQEILIDQDERDQEQQEQHDQEERERKREREREREREQARRQLEAEQQERERERERQAQEPPLNPMEQAQHCATTANRQQCTGAGTIGMAAKRRSQPNDPPTTVSSGSPAATTPSTSKFYYHQDLHDGSDHTLRLKQAEGHFQLAHLLHQEGELLAAKEEYERCLAMAPMHVTANHMLRVVQSAFEAPVTEGAVGVAVGAAAVGTAAVDTYERANEGYVEMLFDSYASTYDAHMVTQLVYRVPHLIVDEMKTQFATMTPSVPPSVPRRLLDLGCGKSIVCAVYSTVLCCAFVVLYCASDRCAPCIQPYYVLSVLITFFSSGQAPG